MNTNLRRVLSVAWIYVVSLAAAPVTQAYEEVAVVDGGVLSGTVVLDGKVPGPKGYNLTTLPDAVYCGRISDGKGWRLLQPFEVGPKGEFRRVVVIEQTITIEPNKEVSLALNVKAPTGRLYANQMVENAYVRYTITEDVQSPIVPTLEKQTYDGR